MSAGRPQKDDSQEEQRESIWSVSPGLLWLYLILFGILFVFGTAYLVYYEITQSATVSGHDVAAAVIKSIGSVAIGSAGVSFFATELTGGTMVLASYLKRKLLDEPRRARERELAELAEVNDENARLKEQVARLKQENARLREENGEPVSQDPDNPNQD